MTVENQSNHNTMPSIIPNHSPNTIHLAHIGKLGDPTQVYGLSIEGAISRHLTIPVTI